MKTQNLLVLAAVAAMLSACGGKSSNKDQVANNNKPKSQVQHKVQECPELTGEYRVIEDGEMQPRGVEFTIGADVSTLKVEGANIPTILVDGQAHDAKIKDQHEKEIAVRYIASCVKGTVVVEGFIPSSGEKVSTSTYMKQGTSFVSKFEKVEGSSVASKLSNSEETWTAAAQ